MSFGERLKKALELRSMRACDLSKKSGISPSMISLYLKDKIHPSFNQINRISKAINVNLNFLTGVEESLEETYLEELTLKILRMSDTDRKYVLDFVNILLNDKSMINDFYSYLLNNKLSDIKNDNLWR